MAKAISTKPVSESEQNFKKGYILMYRSAMEHPYLQGKEAYTKREAWIDLLMEANSKDQKNNLLGSLPIVKRGQSSKSLDTWARRWRWDKSKVRRFLEGLKNRHMIDTKTDAQTTYITICKYDTYQSQRHANRHTDEKKPTPNNKGSKNILNTYYPNPEEFGRIYNESKVVFMDFYLGALGTAYYFKPVDGEKIYSILKQVHFKIKEMSKTELVTADELINGFRLFIIASYKKGDHWIKSNFSLSNIDSKFNDLYTNIKNNQNGQVATSKQSAYDSASKFR